MRYNPAEIEPKWQRYWEEHETFRTDIGSDKPKFYVLDMFPYPSGYGLHVGHAKGYVGSDVVARYRRMRGYEVLHPMGWDAFGLPAERQAVRDGVHPAEVTQRNINTFRRQMKILGLSYDWSRELSTCEPAYYRWTQWIFLKLLERGLAYQTDVPVNWCPALGTVLANEEVKDGFYIETGDPVEVRVMRQWVLRITEYAERLLSDLDLVDWPESVKEMQRHWIGRSEGALIRFEVVGRDGDLEVFSTRPDTLFGCTFCVVAPEHPLAKELSEADPSVEEYLSAVTKRTERERLAQAAPETGVFSGRYAKSPVTGQQIPIWIADYVISGYGTGAIFGCPAHDERDHAFARLFGLPIVPVILGGDNPDLSAHLGDGPHINSGFLDGLDNAQAIQRITEWLEAGGHGEARVSYRLRDWLFSRQRYWGEPIPVLHGTDGRVVPVHESALPVELPDLPDYTKADTVAAPLERAFEWMKVVHPETGEPLRREANTMPQWAGSCWYYLRFIDPLNESRICDKRIEAHWMPVDLYVGGAEHATLHLLYARFWHKVLFDLGVVSTPEPFQKLFNQGMIQAQSFRSEEGRYFSPREVEERDGNWYPIGGSDRLQTQMEKMSKSRFNVVTPDEVISDVGADALRLHEMFLGPLEEGAPWLSDGIVGSRRFLDRVWRLAQRRDDAVPLNEDPELEALLHQTVRKVTEDVEKLRMNTATSQMMILVNEVGDRPRVPGELVDVLIRLLAPFCPHIAEELWSQLGNRTSVAYAVWPAFDVHKAAQEVVTIVVQVNGKLRASLEVPRGSDVVFVREAALINTNVDRHVEGRQIARTIFVPDRIINFVTG